MKRFRGLFVAISFAVAFSAHVYAAGTTSTVTDDQLIKHAEDGLFQENIYALNNEKTAINKDHRNDANYQTLLQTNTAEMQALIAARTAFENTIVQGGSGATPQQKYRDALLAAAAALESSRSSKALLQSQDYPNPSRFIDNFKQQLTTESTNQEWIGAITSGTTLSENAQQQASATKVAANPSSPGATTDASKCEIFKFSLVGCIDIFVAYIIKNTVLQLAGFLVWLCSNMLNYAIQISILGFSKWAPDTLYPIWIVVRQIVSLVVVFAGLYLGFMYIIGREDTFSKYVGWLMIFALFVNFSYPISRALTDISNIVSLNIYASAVGSEVVGIDFSSAATTLGGNTAGALIMNRLGLQGLVGSATAVKGSDATGFVSQINSTPGALIAVAYVAYAAYIFFIATAIIATRTAVLVFLIIASPLLLVDSVVPKLGEVAMKVRKMFFEQLIVAPVFMIMLALTLKFMEVFQAGGALSKASGGGSLTGAGGDITAFFSILMMLIMLHIMLKVTKTIAGEAGNYATNFMGKVGGFGLAAASAGTGLLARGTIGQLAAGARDSKWMDGMKDSRFGRGLYGLSNSLANSTFDSRNIGMVQRGMATAGLTGGLGMTMQKGGTRGFEDERKAREEKVLQFGSNIRDDATRNSYFEKANKGFVYSKVDEAKLRIAKAETQEKKDAQLATLMSTTDKGKRQQLIDQALAGKDFAMADKLKSADAFLKVDNNSPDAASTKAGLLKTMGLTDEKVRDLVNKQDPFADIQKVHDERLKQMKLKLATMKRGTEEEKKAYSDAQAEIGKFEAQHEKQISDLKKATLDTYYAPAAQAAQSQPSQTPTGGTVDQDHPGGSDMSGASKATASGPGGSNTSQYDDKQYQQPAYQRNGGGDPFSASFTQNMRKGGGSSPASGTQTPQKPNAPAPSGEAAAA